MIDPKGPIIGSYIIYRGYSGRVTTSPRITVGRWASGVGRRASGVVLSLPTGGTFLLGWKQHNE